MNNQHFAGAAALSRTSTTSSPASPSGPQDRKGEGRRESRREPQPRARITQQFREARNMTYELAYDDLPLIVRVYPPERPGERSPLAWRIEARMTEGVDAVTATATGSSPAVAFEGVADWWRQNADKLGLPTFDWTALAQAMMAVRAL